MCLFCFAGFRCAGLTGGWKQHNNDDGDNFSKNGFANVNSLALAAKFIAVFRLLEFLLYIALHFSVFSFLLSVFSPLSRFYLRRNLLFWRTFNDHNSLFQFRALFLRQQWNISTSFCYCCFVHAWAMSLLFIFWLSTSKLQNPFSEKLKNLFLFINSWNNIKVLSIWRFWMKGNAD